MCVCLCLVPLDWSCLVDLALDQDEEIIQKGLHTIPVLAVINTGLFPTYSFDWFNNVQLFTITTTQDRKEREKKNTFLEDGWNIISRQGDSLVERGTRCGSDYNIRTAQCCVCFLFFPIPPLSFGTDNTQIPEGVVEFSTLFLFVYIDFNKSVVSMRRSYITKVPSSLGIQ